MSRVIQLQDFAQINSGYQFRNEFSELPPGDWKFIQMRDIDSGNIINPDSVIGIDFKIKDSTSDKYLLKKGDILFKNRGAKNSAAVFNLDWPQVIASHQFLIIRLTDAGIIPEYLAWYINSETARSYFKQQAAGTTTLLVQKRTLEELEIVVPAIDSQKNIIRIESLQRKEKSLIERRMELHSKYIESVLSESINSIRKI
jgi:restriction endonuclease S subunit